jgi:membrane protease YdiL (CAAX protease family)
MLSAKPWRDEAVLQFCGAQLLCFCIGPMIAGWLQKAGLAAFQPPNGFGAVLLNTLSFQGATWVLIPFFLRHHQVGVREAFGWHSEKIKSVLRLVVGVVVVVLPVAWLLQSISIITLTKLGCPPENQRAVELLLNAKSPWLRLYLAFFAMVLAPVAEEFIFRGVLYPFVKQLGSPRAALFGVSALFAAIHFDAGTFVPLFALALALTWLYEKTDNLLAPIAAHSLFNATNLVALLFLPQINQFLQKVLPVQLLK